LADTPSARWLGFPLIFSETTINPLITPLIERPNEGERGSNPCAKIIAITGGGRVGAPAFLDIAKKFGACETLAKPVGAEKLVQRVKRCLQAV